MPSRTRREARERWQNQRDGEQKGQKMGGIEEQPGQEGRRLHSEKHACPRRGNPTAVKAV